MIRKAKKASHLYIWPMGFIFFNLLLFHISLSFLYFDFFCHFTQGFFIFLFLYLFKKFRIWHDLKYLIQQ